MPFIVSAQPSDGGNPDLTPFWNYVKEGDEFVRRAGFADEDGRMVINSQFSSVREFSHGLAPVAKILPETGENEMRGYINTEGEVVIPFQFSVAEPFSGDHAFVKTGGEQYVVINRDGTVLKRLSQTSHHRINTELYRVFTVT
ncbi:MAG: WG repeat-containing protein [Balneolaceae bacterium]|nr:WG repeat-containing protein [Balneolaceae bacterium]